MKTQNHSIGPLAAGLVNIACLLMPAGVTASEGGTGHYLPGAVATMIDLVPTQPGWVVEPIYLHYQGDVGTSNKIPIAGIDALGLSATSDALLAGGFYTLSSQSSGLPTALAPCCRTSG